MTDQNPAGLLREVARLLRDRANAATPGRWSEMHLGSEGCIVINDGKLRDRRRVATFGWKEWKADHADAAYVASVQPSVGLALADWLDSVAAIVEADPHAAESCGCVEAEGYHHAVNVTRAYLGVSDG